MLEYIFVLAAALIPSLLAQQTCSVAVQNVAAGDVFYFAPTDTTEFKQTFDFSKVCPCLVSTGWMLIGSP